MFTLSGAISWVGNQAQLSAKPVSLGDGQQLITQAITEEHIKPRGPGCPHSILPASTSFNLCSQDLPPQPANFLAAAEQWKCPDLVLAQYIRSEVTCHSEAGTKARDNKSYGQPHLSCLCSCQIMDSKVTEVQHQLPHQWHQCLKDWEVLGIHIMADAP